MDNIRQALERARSIPGRSGPQPLIGEYALPPGVDSSTGGHEQTRAQKVALDPRHLESNRIIAHDETDARAISFEMLRTQVLQAMDKKNWSILGVTSPVPNCGKTVISVNLALSISRQPERAAFLIDLDLRKPTVAKYIGLDCREDLLSVLRGQSTLADSLVQAEIGRCKLTVLPTATAASDPSAWISSRALSNLLAGIKRDHRHQTIIVDLPPILSSSDVISILPQLDCVLLIAAVGQTTVEELEECNSHLRSIPVVRIALNKSPQSSSRYYYPY